MSDQDLTKLDLRLHRAQAGTGAPLVLSHGLGDDAETWAALTPLLAACHSVHTWDLRGHRSSEAPDDAGAYTLDSTIDDLRGIVEEIGEPVHLVGHSLGGFMSLALALRRRDLVRTLTMISSGPATAIRMPVRHGTATSSGPCCGCPSHRWSPGWPDRRTAG